MLKLNTSARFKRDCKVCKKRGLQLDLLLTAVDTLRIPEPLPSKNRDHNLAGNYAGFRECHIQPDWLLIYKVANGELYLARIGTHADLFAI